MGTLEVTAQNFKDSVEKQGTLFLDWWAPWCGPCRAFGPVFESVANENPDMVFGKINTEEQQELAAAFSIRSIPTLMVFRDGILLFSQPGALPREALEELVTKVKALDMEKVRKEIAEHEKQNPSTT